MQKNFSGLSGLGVESEVYNLQAQANATADTLSYMFATRADNLVNELASSYYSEQNLGYMTQALQDSLVNTLERGYNISGISSALESIKSSVNGVASAANNAAQALASMGAAQQAYNNAVANGVGVTVVPSSSTNNKSAIREANSSSGQLKTLSGYNNKPTMLRYAKGGIVTKDSRNPLNRIAEAVGEDTLVAAKDGEGFLTQKQTETIQELADTAGDAQAQTADSTDKWRYTPTKEQMEALKEIAVKMGGSVGDGKITFSSERFSPESIGAYMGSLTPVSWDRTDMLDRLVRMPEAVPNNANNTSVTVNMDKMVHVDHIDSTNMKQVEKMISKAQDNFIRKINDGIKYRRL